MESEFWSNTIDAHILQAIILWCMVFGSDKNPTHWKKLTDNNELQEGFRKKLFRKTGFNQQSWNEYWENMVSFRNKYAAHRENYDNLVVPLLGKALDVTYAYDEWVREIRTYEELGISVFVYDFPEPPFEESAEKLRRSVVPMLELLLNQTQHYNQRVPMFKRDPTGRP